MALLVSYTQSISQNDPVYVGVTFCGNTTAQGKALIDRVKTYTNLFILGSGINPISRNLTAAREICDYAINASLYVIIDLGAWDGHFWPQEIQFYNQSKYLYGDKFLGVYYDDEPAGVELDYNWTKALLDYNMRAQFNYNWTHYFNETSAIFSNSSRIAMNSIFGVVQEALAGSPNPDNYTREAAWFNTTLEQNPGLQSVKQYGMNAMTSDYALYWFNYVGGYDTILAQFGWNSSVNQQIALVRGAATLQNKDWGAIITWKYTEAPYLTAHRKSTVKCKQPMTLEPNT